jgi:phosphate transport system substrate-binding protein
VVNASPGAGAVETFTHFFGIGYADIKANSVAGSTVVRVKAIADDPNAISYMSIGAAQTQANKGAAIKLLPADGIAATKQNIQTGNFPLSRPLLLLTKDPAKGLAKEFIAFSLSSQTTDLVLQHGFAPYLD